MIVCVRPGGGVWLAGCYPASFHDLPDQRRRSAAAALLGIKVIK